MISILSIVEIGMVAKNSVYFQDFTYYLIYVFKYWAELKDFQRNYFDAEHRIFGNDRIELEAAQYIVLTTNIYYFYLLSHKTYYVY